MIKEGKFMIITWHEISGVNPNKELESAIRYAKTLKK